jgi:hypothetical protein
LKKYKIYNSEKKKKKQKWLPSNPNLKKGDGSKNSKKKSTKKIKRRN